MWVIAEQLFENKQPHLASGYEIMDYIDSWKRLSMMCCVYKISRSLNLSTIIDGISAVANRVAVGNSRHAIFYETVLIIFSIVSLISM